MKASDFPEKVYIPRDPEYPQSPNIWWERESSESNIEYVRTDAIIEKACDYLMEYEFNDSPTIADRRKRVDEFRKYMEGRIKL